MTRAVSLHAQIAAMRERVDAATEGPWLNAAQLVVNETFEIAECITDNNPPETLPNATFIAHARTDLPKLLDAVEAVVALHQPGEEYHTPAGSGITCTGCPVSAYPCRTITALTSALGGSHE